MTTRYIETIRLENGLFHLLDLHQQRLTATVREIYGDEIIVPDIKTTLSAIADIPVDGIYKCRIVYDTEIREIEFQPYTRRTVRSLKVVEADTDIDYHLKSCDRSALTSLASLKGDCDEVIILRDGLVTDTSYTNLVFHSDTGLYTPRTPLLKGVMRGSLLNQGIIHEIDIRPEDIHPDNPLGITGVSLINAMLPMGSAPVIPVSEIYLDPISQKMGPYMKDLGKGIDTIVLYTALINM